VGKSTDVYVIARRPYDAGARRIAQGERFAVPVLEALKLATRGIVSLSRRPAPPLEQPTQPDPPKRRSRKPAA